MQQYGWHGPENYGMIQTEDCWRLMTKEEFEELQIKEAQKGDRYLDYCFNYDNITKTHTPITYDEYKERVRNWRFTLE